MLKVTSISSATSEELDDEIRIKTDAEIHNDPNFQKVVEVGSLYYKVLTWAGPETGLYEPSIYFPCNGQIVLSKQGYNLPTGNWKKYKDSGNEDALMHFKRELFGRYSENVEMEMKRIFEWIDVEEPGSEKSDFTLTVSFACNFSIGKEKWFFLQALNELVKNE